MPGRSRLNMGMGHSTNVIREDASADLTYNRGSSIILTKNSQFYVRQGDVERLIAQGFLQRLS